MMKYEVGPFKKPNGLLMDKVQKRLTPKSAFLKKIERRQRDLADAAHVVVPTGSGKAGKVRIREAAKRAAEAVKPEPTNKERRVTQLRLAWNRRRDQ